MALLAEAIRTFKAADPAFDDRWYPSLSSYVTSDAGVNVDPEMALSVAVVYRAINVLADSVSMVPLNVLRRLQNDGKERATDHRLYSVLHDRPNQYQTSYRWRHQTMAHLLLWRNAYSRIVSGPGTFASELRPIHPSRMSVLDQFSDGRLLYGLKLNNGTTERLTQDEVVHFRGLSLDGKSGNEAFKLMRNAVGLALAAEKHGSRFLKQGSRLSGVLEHPTTFSSVDIRERVRNSWQEAYGGLENTGKTPVLEDGMKYSPISANHKDSQYIESRTFQVEEILRFLGVPGVLCGYTDKTATFASAESFFLNYVKFVVMPWVANLESELEEALLLTAERKTYCIEFELKGLLRGDPKAWAEQNQIAVLSGWKSRNEVRREDNLDTSDPELDKFIYPSNEAVAGEEPDPAEPKPPQGGMPAEPLADAERLAERARVMATRNALRIVRKERARILGAPGQAGLAKRFAGDPAKWAEELSDFYAAHAAFVAETMCIEVSDAEAYCEDQRAALVADGVGIMESWMEEKTAALVGLALGA